MRHGSKSSSSLRGFPVSLVGHSVQTWRSWSSTRCPPGRTPRVCGPSLRRRPTGRRFRSSRATCGPTAFLFSSASLERSCRCAGPTRSPGRRHNSPKGRGYSALTASKTSCRMFGKTREHDERTRERIEAALVLGDDLRLDSRPELVERWATPSGSSRGVAQAQWMGSRISSSSERGGSPIRLSESSSAISAGVLRRRAVSKATPATIVPATKENAPSRWKKSGSHPSGWGVGEALDAWTRA